MTGTTDGQSMSGTHVLESYKATTLATPEYSAKTFYVHQIPSDKDYNIPVSFNISDHSGSTTPPGSSVGLFSVAVPLVDGTKEIQLLNGSGTVLYTVDNSFTAPTIPTAPAIARRLAADPVNLRTITASQANTACATKDSSHIGTGIAFDGSHLLVSC